MTETTDLGRRKNSDGPPVLRARRKRLFGALLVLGLAVGGFLLGRMTARLDLSAARAMNQQFQTESQNLKAQIADLNAKNATLQAALTTAQAALNAIMPSANTYNISPNQSLIVGDGHLTVGLVGSPTNEGVNLNINGTQHSAVAGDVIRIDVDPSTNCQVAVQSFDMFKAILTASCATAKHQ